MSLPPPSGNANRLQAFWTIVPESVTSFVAGNSDGGGGPIGPVENPDSSGGSPGPILTDNPDGNPDGPPPIVVEPIGPRYGLRFSVVVQFRLSIVNGNGNSFTLAPFQPLIDWPATIAAATKGVKFAATGDTVYSATLQSSPSTAVWQKLFPPTTTVKPAVASAYVAREQAPIRSFPRREIAAYVQDLHLGLVDTPNAVVPPSPPSPAKLLSSYAALRQSPQVVTNLRSMQISALSTNYAVPRSLTQPLSPTQAVASDFIQLADYFNPGSSTDDEPVEERVQVPVYDFHQLAGLGLMQPVVGRSLGMILDFTVDNIPGAVAGDGEMQFDIAYSQANVQQSNVFFKTAYHLVPDGFEVRAAGDLLDLDGRYLRVGDQEEFGVEEGLDVDSAGVKSMDFARSLTGRVPALRTAGPAITRIDAATKLRTTRRRDRARFNAAFAKPPVTTVPLVDADAQPSPDFLNHAEDLVRGYRVDVWDETSQRWFSLHHRSGEFRVGDQGNDIAVPVTFSVSEAGVVANPGEGFVSTTPVQLRPVTKGQTVSNDYLLTEVLARWSGWSLSVPRVGRPITNDDVLLQRSPTTNKPVFPRPEGAVGKVMNLVHTAHELPRLRFGRTYRFRVRIVDVAGNSVAFDRTVTPEELGDLVSMPIAYARFDPMESPTLLLREQPGAGESVHEIVVRSEDLADNAADSSERLVPPPATTQWLAEMHGGFEAAFLSTDNAVDAYTLLEEREGLTWAASPLRQDVNPNGASSEVFIPVQSGSDTVPVPYLADFAARRAAVINLPGSPGLAYLTYGGSWPNVNAAKLALHKGTGVAGEGQSGQAPNARDRIDITLHKGDIRTISLASAMSDPAGSGEVPPELFGVYNWMLRKAQANNPNFNPTVLKQMIAGGMHPAVSPRQEVRLVHAVRKPLRPANFNPQAGAFQEVWVVDRVAGETSGFANGQVRYSPRSTGRIDVAAAWNDYIDRGRGTGDPRTPIPRSVPVTSKELDRDAVEEGLAVDNAILNIAPADGRHEIGDTRHHLVTYQAKATSAFLSYFRETKLIPPFQVGTANASTPIIPVTAGGISPAPVMVTGVATGNTYVDGVDYRIDRAVGRLVRLKTSFASGNAGSEAVNVSFIRGDIEWAGEPIQRHVAATARPAAPKLHSIVPTFKWAAQTLSAEPILNLPKRKRSVRSGGGLRVWLDRPWFSSGEDEYLAVTLSPSGMGNADNRPFISIAGTDPITAGRDTAHFLTPAHFTGNALPAVDAALAETNRLVKVVPYKVEYDADRDQWFADITVNPSLVSDKQVGHFPFVKLALARYQPYAVPTGVLAGDGVGTGQTNVSATVALSPVVVADFVQVAPQRDVIVSKNARTGAINVTVLGESYSAMQSEGQSFQNADAFTNGRGPSQMIVFLQERDTQVSDDVLGWNDLSGNPIGGARRVTLTPSGPSDETRYSWTGTIPAPRARTLSNRTIAYRVVVEEFEKHYSDADSFTTGLPSIGQVGGSNTPALPSYQIPSGMRCVFQDMILLEGL